MPVVLNISGHASCVCVQRSLAAGGGGTTPEIPCGIMSNISNFFFPRVSLDSSAPRESQGFQDSQELRWGVFCLECIIHANDNGSFDRFFCTSCQSDCH